MLFKSTILIFFSSTTGVVSFSSGEELPLSFPLKIFITTNDPVITTKAIKKPITTLKYVHCKYGPIIDKKDAYLNFLIQQNYIEIVDNVDDIVLFKPIKDYDKSILFIF